MRKCGIEIMLTIISSVCLLSGCKSSVTESENVPAPVKTTPVAVTEVPIAEPVLADVEAVDDKGNYTCLYQGLHRKFILYIPEKAGENAPLLFMLHGYADQADGFARNTGMNETAAEYGYTVVYPQGMRDPGDAAGGAGWNSGLKSTGNDDTGYLVALAHYLQETYGFSPDATFAAGFSNGAFMMYRLACEAPETFRGVASVAGFMTEGAWAERPDQASVSILQINGTQDDVVPMEGSSSSSNAKVPKIDEVIRFWKDADGLQNYEEIKLSDKATAYYYSDTAKSCLVRHIVIEDGRHSWPDEKFSGINTNRTIIDFFEQHRQIQLPVPE